MRKSSGVDSSKPVSGLFERTSNESAKTGRRRRSKGAAWHWKQTDAWYYTPPGTRKRVALREGGVAKGTVSADHRSSSIRYLNDLCGYCGAQPVRELNKGHVQHWIESHSTWSSPATIRAVEVEEVSMARKKKRRQSHGSAWHWRQTDCWYATLPGTKKRVPLHDEKGERIRGKEQKEAAEVALARLKLSGEGWPATETDGEWIVARVCSEYIQYCKRGLDSGAIGKSHHGNTVNFLNALCKYCGALPVAELKKSQVETWLESQSNWRSPATRRGVISIVLAAFNRAQETHGVRNPLAGLKKPAANRRLQSIPPGDEEILYAATDEVFRDFLFGLIHTGLRPFCEMARLTSDDVEESERGMMWRVYSTKTKKTRKIPVRPEVAELTRKLMATAPRESGVRLFRNSRGGPWTEMAGVVRYLSLKKKLGWDKDPVKKKYSCYTCRHTFAHRMLSGYWNQGKGCSIETLAELIGDTPKVAFDHYGREWGQH